MGDARLPRRRIDRTDPKGMRCAFGFVFFAFAAPHTNVTRNVRVTYHVREVHIFGKNFLDAESRYGGD